MKEYDEKYNHDHLSDLSDEVLSQYHSYESSFFGFENEAIQAEELFYNEYYSSGGEFFPQKEPSFYDEQIKTIDISEAKEVRVKANEVIVSEESIPTSYLEVNNGNELQTDTYYKSIIKEEKPKKKHNPFMRFVAAVLIVSLVGGATLGVGMGLSKPFFEKQLAESVAVIGENTPTDAIDESDNAGVFNFDNNVVATAEVNAPASSSTIINIVKTIEPSVVNITSMSVSASQYDFFRSIPREQEGSGSGIIFYEDQQKIFIVTNAHVIANATSVNISIFEDEQIPASLVGWDEQSDVAVISCNKADISNDILTRMKPANFGTSDSLEVGEIVVAMGNALGEGKSATLGIISAKNKEITVNDRKLNVIKTDAAINPGNSGGPLVNDKGEVIGLNTAKYSVAGVEGSGYAIPIDDAKPIIEQLINTGTVPRPYLGIRGSDVSSATAALYDLPIGVYVESIEPGSSAAIAGMLQHDIIIEFDGTKIMNFDMLSKSIKSHKVGDTVEVKVIRNGREAVTLKVVLQDANQPKSSITSNQ